MRVSKPIILYLPDLLVNELDKYLKNNPPNFKFHRIYFHYVIHRLVTTQIQNKKKKYFNLHLDSLKEVTAHNIGRYIRILRDGEFIISDNNCIPGRKKYWYRLNDKYVKGLIKIELKSKSKIYDKIIKYHRKNKAHYSQSKPYLRLIWDEFKKMALDYEMAKKWIEINANDSQKISYLTSINQLEDKRFRYFKRNNTNRRLDTNLTNLKSDLKQFIIGDYVNIDLKNSQPFLLSILISSILNTNHTLCGLLKDKNLLKTFGAKGFKRVLLIHQKQEKVNMVNFRMFYDAVLNGSLYEEFVRLYPGDLNRKAVKKIIFKVLFSEIQHYRKRKEIFSTVYPFISEVVEALKVKDYKTLPIYLQRLESYLFIDCIAKELVNNGIIPLTIHDSVIVKFQNKRRAIQIIKKEFIKQFGVVPSFSIKRLK